MGDAVVGYIGKHGVAVVAGAPICPEERLSDVLSEWEAFAEGHCLRTCYFGAAGRAYDLLHSRADYSSIVLGAQPVWRPGAWEVMTGRHASLRAQFARSRNKGVSVSEWPRDRARGNSELRGCLHEWLETRGLPPLHFLVEPETLGYLQDRRLFVAERGGRVVGFLTLCPVPCRNGWLTEQFPRRSSAPNGTVELLLDCANRAIAQEGSDYLTMGLVPLAEISWPPRSEDPAWIRFLLRWIRAHGRRFYNFAGLEAFKSKFRPAEWEPIYAISNERHFSFRSLYAIAAAFSGRSPVIAVAQGIGKAIRQEMQWITGGRR